MKQPIYFDNAATTALSPAAYEAMMDVMQNHYGNPSSIHALGRQSRMIIEQSRKKIAGILKASIGEIFFTSSATEANNLILKNAVRHGGIQRIITSPIEHHCVLHSIDYLKEHTEVEVIYLNVNKKGEISYDELENWLKDNRKETLVSLMYGNNEIGNITDIIKVGQMCKTNGARFHTDAVQALGKIKFDVSDGVIDYLSGSAHKFHGPKGVGFFYMSGDAILPPSIHGGAQERNMRAGTENVPGIAGMAAALEDAITNLEERQSKIRTLRLAMIKELQQIPDIQINGSENTLAHILSVSFPPSPKAELLMFNLDIEGICASSGSACSSGIENDSHVLEAIGHDPRRKTIRFSFSHNNTLMEIQQVGQIIKKLTKDIE